jgi:hypothetical protein
MNSREFIEFCAAAEHGGDRFVRFIDRHEGTSFSHEHVGRVIGCDGRRLEVVTEDGHHTWPMESCEPVNP